MKISFNKEDNIWFATSSAAINYDSTEKKEYLNHYHSLIRKVNIQLDSVIFWGTNYSDTSKMVISCKQPDNLKYTYDYKHNFTSVLNNKKR